MRHGSAKFLLLRQPGCPCGTRGFPSSGCPEFGFIGYLFNVLFYIKANLMPNVIYRFNLLILKDIFKCWNQNNRRDVTFFVPHPSQIKWFFFRIMPKGGLGMEEVRRGFSFLLWRSVSVLPPGSPVWAAFQPWTSAAYPWIRYSPAPCRKPVDHGTISSTPSVSCRKTSRRDRSERDGQDISHRPVQTRGWEAHHKWPSFVFTPWLVVFRNLQSEIILYFFSLEVLLRSSSLISRRRSFPTFDFGSMSLNSIYCGIL